MHVFARFADSPVGCCRQPPLTLWLSSIGAPNAVLCGCATSASQTRHRRSSCGRVT